MFSKFYCFVFLMLMQVGQGAADVDFQRDILPIFEKHCFDCHSEGNIEGELSLESPAAIRRGGHTGVPLLSASAIESELYRRITSNSEGYRMPKRGDSLAKRDVNTIASWITQVSGSSVQPSVADSDGDALAEVRSRDGNPIGSTILGIETSKFVTMVVSMVIFLSLIAWLVFRFITSRTSKRKFSDNEDRWIAVVATTVGAINLLAFVALGYFYIRADRLADENATLKAKLQTVKPSTSPIIQIDSTHLPLPPHPMHPPRLGGQYYRGNDERDASLYNGGFYRTATIDLHLVDSDGQRVEIDDSLDEELAIEIVIKRAPKATKELFSESVLEMVSLDHYNENVPGLNKTLKFTVVEKEDLWKVVVPLLPREQWDNGKLRGMVYLMHGVQPGPLQLPRPHFAIRYDLRAVGDKIVNGSELWMGSMYTLGNRVLVPENGKILLDRWFDWRPIPVIDGDAATDRKLLGVEEHLDL